MTRNEYENAADEVAYLAGNLKHGLTSLLQIATTLDKKSDDLVAMIEDVEIEEIDGV